MFPSGWTAPTLVPRIPEVEPLMAKEGKTLALWSDGGKRPPLVVSNQGGAQWRVEAFTLEEMYEKLGWVSEHGPISATAPMRLSRQIVNERRSSLQGTNYAVFVKDDPTGMGVCVPYADGRGFRPLWLTGTALKKAVQSANLDLLQQTDTWATVAADEGDPGTLLLLGRIFCVADDIVLSRRGRRLLKTAYKLLRNKHMLKRLKELGH